MTMIMSMANLLNEFNLLISIYCIP